MPMVKANKASQPHAAESLREGLGLTDLPEYEAPLWFRLNKQVQRFLKQTKGQAVLSAAALTLGLTLVLGASFLNVMKVARNGLATTTVVTRQHLEVKDEQATLLKQQQAKSAIPPVYKEVEPYNTHMQQALEQRLERLHTLLWQVSTASDEPARTTARKLLAAELGFNENKLPGWVVQLKADTLRPLLNEATWQHLKLSSELALGTLLKQGLTMDAYIKEREERVQETLPAHLLTSPTERALANALVLSVLTPNLLEDEAATRLARLQAASKVQTVVVSFKPGDVLLRQGEPLTPLKKQALAELGIAVESVHWLGLLAVAIYSALGVTLLGLSTRFLNQGRFWKPNYLWMLCSVVAVTLFGLKLHSSVLASWPLLAFPLPAMAASLAILMHPWPALVAISLSAVIAGLTLKLSGFTLAALWLGSVAVCLRLGYIKTFKSRNQLLLALCFGTATTLAGVIAAYLLQHPGGNHWDWSPLLGDITVALLGGVASAAITLALLPLLEAAFQLLTPFKLLELANHDNPLLKRLQFEAPGTFHHSLMMASLSEAAAEAIGADTLLTRVGCLYHDVGKMKRPLYFIENQAYFGAENPHDRLPPRLSKRVITQHPKDSIEMGKKAGLPDVICDFMTEHHGTLMCGYFYQKALQEEGSEHVDKAQFRYAGPKPRSKETAISMLADAAESAVRALKNPTMSQMEELIDKLFKQRLEDGQFDDCPITMQELRLVRETFVRVLMGIQHQRINYQEKILKEFEGKALPTYGKP